MEYANKSILSFMAGTMLLLTACNAHAIPTASSPSFATGDPSVVDNVDTTSILKKLKKNVTIGSTVDPTNGDQGPRGLAWVAAGSGALTKGQLLFCDFEDKSGAAGKGMSVDKLDSKPGSKPATFVQNVKSAGCADDSLSPASDPRIPPVLQVTSSSSTIRTANW